MPQAIAAWCRRDGHRIAYRTYYGVGDPGHCIPHDVDILFIASYTQASPLAYALAKVYSAKGVRTAIGGPHARAFPSDCLRFFDYVVHSCDQALIRDVLAGEYAPGSIVRSERPLD